MFRQLFFKMSRDFKKGELLNAFSKGDIEKIQRLTKNIPDYDKASIPVIVKEYKNCSRRTTPLSVSIVYGNYHLCRLLVEDGISLQGDFEKQLRPLSLALLKNHSDIAELLIDLGADVNMLENDGNTYPLYWAIHEKHPPHVIDKIINAGFHINSFVVKQEKLTAILVAVSENNREAVKTLLKYPSVDLNITNSSGETPLNIAVRKNLLDIVKLLIENGADLKNSNASMCPLFLAIRFEYLKMVELLIDLGADVQEGWVLKEIVPPLQFAISYLNLEIVLLLISRGADVKAKHRGSHETALHVVATYLGVKYKGDVLRALQIKIAKALIAKGAEVNVKDIDGRTPLDGAIFSENTELCKLFLKEGAEIIGFGSIRGDGKLSNRFEYISCVSSFKCPELIRLCLERGADYNFRDRHGLSPYHCVMAKHNPDMVRAFWQYGCPYDQPELKPGKMKEMLWYEPDPRDKKMFAVQAEFMDGIKNNRVDIVTHALKKGAEPRGCSMNILSTLHYVAANGNHKIARVLLENGVAVNKINETGHTPLYIAVEKKHVQACKVFLQFGACYNYWSKKLAKNKTIKVLVREDEELQQLFKKISKYFKLAKQGNPKLLQHLLKYKTSGEKEMLSILMNCVNNAGLTLMGTALSLGFKDLAKEIMQFRVKYM